jgi:hypothetical protein
LPLIRDLFCRVPDLQDLEPWELQSALFILGYVDEVAIAGALEALWINGEIVSVETPASLASARRIRILSA